MDLIKVFNNMESWTTRDVFSTPEFFLKYSVHDELHGKGLRIIPSVPTNEAGRKYNITCGPNTVVVMLTNTPNYNTAYLKDKWLGYVVLHHNKDHVGRVFFITPRYFHPLPIYRFPSIVSQVALGIARSHSSVDVYHIFEYAAYDKTKVPLGTFYAEAMAHVDSGSRINS